jgi:hypothetical protein
VVKADNIFPALASLALNADELLRIDVIAVVRRVIASVAGPRDASHGLGAIVGELAEQHTATLMGIGFFAVLAERIVHVSGNSEHENLRGQRSDCRGKQLKDLEPYLCNLTSDL